MIKSLLIIADLEGCAGVYDLSMKSIELMNIQVNYVLKYIEKNFSLNVEVLDFHDSGNNLISTAEKNPNVRFIKHIWNFNDTIHYDAAILLGFHAKGGIYGGLSHTFRGDIKRVLLGKKEVGEAEIICNWLYSLGIPVLLINGDEFFCANTELGIPKFSLKKNYMDLDKTYIEAYYEQLCLSIHKAIVSPIPSYQYINEKVYMELKYEFQKLYFPANHFKVKRNMLVFENTNYFLSYLQEICTILNSAFKITSVRLERLIKYIKFHYHKEQIDLIDDVKFKSIMNDIECIDVNIIDEIYILKILDKVSSNK